MPEPIILTPLNRDPIPLRDDEGREWLLVPRLKGAEAIRLMRETGLATSAISGDESLEWFARILSRSMRRHHPEMTPEKVLEELDAVHIVEAVVAFLARVGLSASSSAKAAARARQRLEARTKTATTSAPASD